MVLNLIAFSVTISYFFVTSSNFLCLVFVLYPLAANPKEISFQDQEFNIIDRKKKKGKKSEMSYGIVSGPNKKECFKAHDFLDNQDQRN